MPRCRKKKSKPSLVERSFPAFSGNPVVGVTGLTGVRLPVLRNSTLTWFDETDPAARPVVARGGVPVPPAARQEVIQALRTGSAVFADGAVAVQSGTNYDIVDWSRNRPAPIPPNGIRYDGSTQNPDGTISHRYVETSVPSAFAIGDFASDVAARDRCSYEVERVRDNGSWRVVATHGTAT